MAPTIFVRCHSSDRNPSYLNILNIQFDAFFLTIFQKGNSWKKIYIYTWNHFSQETKCRRWDWVANRLVIDWNSIGTLEGGYVYERWYIFFFFFFPFYHGSCNAEIYIIKFETAYYNKWSWWLNLLQRLLLKDIVVTNGSFAK